MTPAEIARALFEVNEEDPHADEILGVVLAGVQHYTGHWCIAIATVAGLLFLRGGV